MIALLSFISGAVLAQHAMPCFYYGTVKVDGKNVAEGTAVSAWIGQLSWATRTLNNGGESWYAIEIPADNPATPGKDGGLPNDLITVKIGEVPAEQTARWQEGIYQASNRLDLIAGQSTPTPTSSPRPYRRQCPLLLKF